MEEVRVEGAVEITVVDKDGKLKLHQVLPNTWTQDGIREIIKWMVGQSAVSPTHVAIGTDGTDADPTQTALLAELDYATYTEEGGRIATTKEIQTVYFTNDTAVYTGTWTFKGTPPTIREMGLFSASTGGVMYARRTMNFTPAAGDKLTVSWKLTIKI